VASLGNFCRSYPLRPITAYCLLWVRSSQRRLALFCCFWSSRKRAKN